ncbi:hypothetical protein AOL_s00076g363 [Orbilia oligospora ATCC 24927]|uniref:Sacsin/Nov domain-containing protein n=1 Tax=Arthrobotrys oligospora (strain ATCC 24927 / CBS 115.81 / DSM 1491) TaxID=756982 RepID=G1X9Q6_ARTOA|nr:hypothetical protein AOL_s00076g363 [Orbilia oligospora ATCC 24927]EGX50158.1 hypothetical protein AOL_s00076g363 [Orbilia oligospora ATCC 24927]
MSVIDYNSLRQTTLGSGVDEEAVTVNTRALIDKVLARYSGEHTTLRELLQNAADASATRVEIRYETAGPTSADSSVDLSSMTPTQRKNEELKRLLKSKCKRMLVKNDGIPFREEDWQRLKRIAEGNPDETKIGAFGVGFYSVFDECEEPFVSSGSQAMAFYWKGNQLFTRRAKLPQHDPMTTFLLEYRQPADPPPLVSLSQFLATSLTFVSLEKVDLYIDNYCVTSIKKKTSPANPLGLPGSISTAQKGTGAMLKIVGVDSESVQLTADVMGLVTYKEKPKLGQAVADTVTSGFRGFWQRLAQPAVSNSLKDISRNGSSANLVDTVDLSKVTSSTIFIRIATANLQSNVGSTFAANLERATKKPPPRRTKCAILTMSKEELDASESVDSKSDTFIFANVLPTKLGKIFIGFATHQTTAIRAHFAAHSVIPTVERESIDFNARYVKEWNAEMLRMAGILARIVYFYEMSDLRGRIQPGEGKYTTTIDAWNKVAPSVLHIMNMFTFVESTPSPVVGQIIEEAFWQCSNVVEVISTKGILPSNTIRIIPKGAEEISSFLSGIPLLPPTIQTDAPVFVRALRLYGFIHEFSLSDMRTELENRALTGAQMVVFLKWLAKKMMSGDVSQEFVQELLRVAVASSTNPEETEKPEVTGTPIALAGITSFVTPAVLPPEMPVPPTCIPFSLTKTMKREELQALGWRELDLVEWALYLASPETLSQIAIEHNITLSAQFAAHFHAILAKPWKKLVPNDKNAIATVLKPISCVPSSKGMKRPGEAYFPTVKIFKDLPIIQSMNGVKEDYLMALGVRKTLELSLVLERLQAKGDDTAATWSAYDLIKYFTSVSQDIPPEDILKLKQTPFCKADGDDKKIYRAMDLFVPKPELRELECPIIQWPGGAQNWRGGQTAEEKFVLKLGLNQFPSSNYLLQVFIAAQERDVVKAHARREKALKYYTTNYVLNNYNYYQIGEQNTPFLPLDGPNARAGIPKLGAPNQCFTNPRAAVLGVPILREDLREHAAKFGVKADPSMDFAVRKLMERPPNTPAEAKTTFGYFASRLAEIHPTHVEKLGKSPIVPIMSNGRLKFTTPRNCFLGDESSQFRDVFDFVDFGADANPFLMKCGTKLEPTISEIAYMLTRDSERLLASCETSIKYLNILRRVAEAYQELKQDRVLHKAMKHSRFLLATIEKTESANELVDVDDDEKNIKEYQLASADEIAIVDDFILFNIFKSDVLTCPQEETLESFYTGLGSTQISKQIALEWTIGRIIQDPLKSKQIRELCLERCRLFFHNNHSLVKHDIKWLESNLEVWIVNSIRLRRTLHSPGSKSHVEKTTAAIVNSKDKTNAILHVTQDYKVFDVAAQLLKLILVKPKPHSALLLESLLSTDLYTLKSRGYNVDRILRLKKENEMRVAEEQKRRLEAQRKAQEEADKLHQQNSQAIAIHHDDDKPPPYPNENEPVSGLSTTPTRHKMPGAFFDSPEDNSRGPPPLETRLEGKRGGLFNRLRTGLGFDQENGIRAGTPDVLGGPLGRPTSTVQQSSGWEGDGGDIKATSPETLDRTLKDAIGALKPFGSTNIFSPPQTNQVKEQNTYCDARPSTDLVRVCQFPTGVDFFMTNNTSEKDKQDFVNNHMQDLILFSSVIATLAQKVFEIPLKKIQLYYESSRTIAFNTSGSLFCNYSYFMQLHATPIKSGLSTAEGDTMTYWYVVMCHEIAHNLVPDHSAAHSYYTESFVTHYMRKYISVMKRGVEKPNEKKPERIAPGPNRIPVNVHHGGGHGNGPTSSAQGGGSSGWF